MKDQIIIEADLNNDAHSGAVMELMNEYTQDIMGGGQPLSKAAAMRLLPALRKRSGVYVFLAFVDSAPAGMAICFEGFSTFAAKPLINIHDFIVKNEFRGLGIGRKMMKKIEDKAHETGCCKITLEVLEGNKPAIKLYTSAGFANYELDKSMGKAVFMEKKLAQGR